MFSALGKKHFRFSIAPCCPDTALAHTLARLRVLAPLRVHTERRPLSPLPPCTCGPEAAPALRHLPGQRRADLQSGQSRNDFDCGAIGLYSREVVQQAVAEDAKDGGMVTWETRGEAAVSGRRQPPEWEQCKPSGGSGPSPASPTHGPRGSPWRRSSLQQPRAHLTRLPTPQ